MRLLTTREMEDALGWLKLCRARATTDMLLGPAQDVSSLFDIITTVERALHAYAKMIGITNVLGRVIQVDTLLKVVTEQINGALLVDRA